jgi:hypothetical protein
VLLVAARVGVIVRVTVDAASVAVRVKVDVRVGVREGVAPGVTVRVGVTLVAVGEKRLVKVTVRDGMTLADGDPVAPGVSVGARVGRGAWVGVARRVDCGSGTVIKTLDVGAVLVWFEEPVGVVNGTT